jgi:DNA-directed RNA polymerase subunit K/omega
MADAIKIKKGDVKPKIEKGDVKPKIEKELNDIVKDMVKIKIEEGDVKPKIEKGDVKPKIEKELNDIVKDMVKIKIEEGDVKPKIEIGEDTAVKGERMPPPTQQQKHASARLTKYERTQVIGVRSEQLARGAQAFVEIDPAGRETVFEIAERELDARRLPLTVVRSLPDGKTEHLRLAH